MVRTVAFHNLGCKVNGYETDVMIQKMRERGYRIVPFEERADIYVINTCTVTNIADRKSRQMLHRAKKNNPEAVVVAVGCYVETDAEGVRRDPAVDLAVGNNRKSDIALILDEFLAAREGDGRAEAVSAAYLPVSGNLTDHPVFESMMLGSPGHTRAYIKIQDGCNQFCSYCIIPYARGRVRSRDEEEILTELRGLAAAGVREAVITGIHIGSYGLDRENAAREKETGERRETPAGVGGAALQRLLLRIAEIPGIERIRLGSLEPRVMTEEFVSAIAAEKKICPHFHLSLQSGSNAVLRRMNRHYTAEEFMACAERLRRYYDRPALTTDVIVGFPGETEAEFQETLRFLRAVDFYEIHVFRYSARHGTVAAAMPEQVPESVKAERSELVQELTRHQSRRYREQFLGETELLLVEELQSGREMARRTQLRTEMSPEGSPERAPAVRASAMEAAGAAQREAAPETDYLIGYTSRYLPCAIPAGELGAKPGELVEGRLVRELPGTAFLEMNAGASYSAPAAGERKE